MKINISKLFVDDCDYYAYFKYAGQLIVDKNLEIEGQLELHYELNNLKDSFGIKNYQVFNIEISDKVYLVTSEEKITISPEVFGRLIGLKPHGVFEEYQGEYQLIVWGKEELNFYQSHFFDPWEGKREDKLKKLLLNIIDLDPEVHQIIEDNFWEML